MPIQIPIPMTSSTRTPSLYDNIIREGCFCCGDCCVEVEEQSSWKKRLEEGQGCAVKEELDWVKIFS